METTASVARKLFQILIGSAIRRCHLAGSLCRLTASLKCFRDSNPPSVRISISDTGIGSSLVEFMDLGFANPALSDKWDGLLCITTTDIPEKDIHHYRLNLRETLVSRTRLKGLSPTPKNIGTFSGTEVCFSIAHEDNIDDLVVWVIHFVQKILILIPHNIAVELVVEHIDSQETRRDHLFQETDDTSLPISMSSIERLVSGLEDYVLKHGNNADAEHRTCSTRREHLKVGNGQACYAENGRGTGQVVEAVIVIAAVSSQPCCWRANFPTTQVLYFQDLSPSSISQSSLNALTSIDWKHYGLRLKNNFLDGEGHAVLEWENIPSFAHIDIAIHSYYRTTIPQARQETPGEKMLVKKAVKNALDDLKQKYTGLFLSSHALKIQEYAPDLSRAIAGLILSSNDLEFQGECAALLGLDLAESSAEERVESCIREKIIGIIEMNDKMPKAERDSVPCLFECEPLHEDGCLEEDEGIEEDGILDL